MKTNKRVIIEKDMLISRTWVFDMNNKSDLKSMYGTTTVVEARYFKQDFNIKQNVHRI